MHKTAEGTKQPKAQNGRRYPTTRFLGNTYTVNIMAKNTSISRGRSKNGIRHKTAHILGNPINGKKYMNLKGEE